MLKQRKSIFDLHIASNKHVNWWVLRCWQAASSNVAIMTPEYAHHSAIMDQRPECIGGNVILYRYIHITRKITSLQFYCTPHSFMNL